MLVLWTLCLSSSNFFMWGFVVSLALILFSLFLMESLLMQMVKVWFSFPLFSLFFNPIEVEDSSIEVESGWMGEVGWNFFGAFVVLLLVVGFHFPSITILFVSLSLLSYGGGESGGAFSHGV